MSELIQESKYITVQEFMPKWTALKEKIGDGRMSMFQEMEVGLDYIDCSQCLVGEAHGGNGDYSDKLNKDYCSECFWTAMGGKELKVGKDSDVPSTYARSKTVREFYQFKQYVYDHMMQAHPEKLLRK